MTAYAATRVLSLLGVGKRRPATAAFTAAAAASSGKAGPALLRAIGSSRLAPAVRQLGALHGCAVVCSAAGGANVLEVQLKVDGMVCEGCSGRVQETLEKMAGVKKVHVDLEKGLATVEVEASATAADVMVEAVRELGFEAELQPAA